MKKNFLLSMITLLAMTAVCGLFTSCGDDDDNDTPVTPPSSAKVESATFTYTILVGKDVLDWSDLAVTLTPSNGSATTTTLTANNGKQLNKLTALEKVYVQKLTEGLSGSQDDYYVYSIPQTINQFPSQITVQYQWNLKSGYSAPESTVPVTIGSCYTAMTNTNQTVNAGAVRVYATVQGQKLADYINSQVNYLGRTYSLSVADNLLTIQ